jgi:hypothetical protein
MRSHDYTCPYGAVLTRSPSAASENDCPIRQLKLGEYRCQYRQLCTAPKNVRDIEL